MFEWDRSKRAMRKLTYLKKIMSSMINHGEKNKNKKIKIKNNKKGSPNRVTFLFLSSPTRSSKLFIDSFKNYYKFQKFPLFFFFFKYI